MKLAKQVLTILTAAAVLAAVTIPAASAAALTATPLTSAVLVDGAEKSFCAYSIGGSSYFRLRDIAYVLNGTAKQFQVTFNAMENKIDLSSGAVYTPIGGEMVMSVPTKSMPATPVSYNVYLDGRKLNLETYVVGVYYFVKLRDLAAAVNFGADYLAQRDAISIDTTIGYKPPVTADELQVTMIGDSLGVGVEPYLKKLLPKLDNHSKVSRQFHQAKAVVQELLQKGRLAPTVIIQLGTNGTVKESDMRALIELIGSDRKIVFVNCQVPRSWCEGDNKTFAKVVPDYPNTIIADWYSASLDKKNYFAKDGVHPTKTGATVLAKVIADAVLAIQ